MKYILIFFVSLLITLLATPYLIEYLKNRGVVDTPSERKIHNSVIPRMGGLVLFAVVSVIILSFYPDLASLRFLLLGLYVIAACGVLDDIFGINWQAKFGFQFVSAFFMILFFWSKYDSIAILNLTLPTPLNYFILLVFIIGTINSVNLMDGLDGLVSGFALIVMLVLLSLAIYFNDELILIISLSLVGALAGFLKFNAFPARVFLGDTGSLFLGFMLVFSSIQLSFNLSPGVLDLTFPIILLSLPILDTLKVMTNRVLKKKNPFLPDKNHLHHIIFLNNINQKTTVFIILSFSVVFAVFSLYYIRANGNSYFIFISYVILLLLLYFVKDLIGAIKKLRLSNRAILMIMSVPAGALKVFQPIFILLTLLSLTVIIISSLNVYSELSFNEITLLIFFGFTLLFVSVKHVKNKQTYYNIYILFNLGVFFLSRNDFGLYAQRNFSSAFVFSEVIILISITVFTSLLMLFLVFRIRVIPSEVMFLSGVDLIIVVVIGLLFIIQTFHQRYDYAFIAESMLLAYLIYLWSKVIASMYKKLSLYILFGSFVFPFLALFIKYFN